MIQPRVVGSSVGLSPTLSFLSLIVWAAILGGVGAFLAVPATLFVKALFFDVDPERRWVIPLISSSSDADPTEDPPPDAKRAADDSSDQLTEPAPVAPAKSANPE